MENATKALLIAAGVLIVILLIAFGMSIFNSTGDTSDQAEEVGEAIKGQTTEATNSAMIAMGYEWVEDTDKDEEGNQPGWVKQQ